MTTMNDAPLGYMPIPTVEQLAEALANVRCFHDLSAELIAPELLENLLAAMKAQAAPVGEREALAEKLRTDAIAIFGEGQSERDIIEWFYGSLLAAAPATPAAQGAVPGLRHTDQWESARVADYNAGWNDRHTAEFSRLTDDQIFDIAEPFGEFRYGDAQGDKRIAFARAIIAAIAAAPAHPAGCKVAPVELLEDLRDLAADAVDHHRAAYAGYKKERQARMDKTVAEASALLASAEGGER